MVWQKPNTFSIGVLGMSSYTYTRIFGLVRASILSGIGLHVLPTCTAGIGLPGRRLKRSFGAQCIRCTWISLEAYEALYVVKTDVPEIVRGGTR